MAKAISAPVGARGRNRHGVYVTGIKKFRVAKLDKNIFIDIQVVQDPVDKKWRGAYWVEGYGQGLQFGFGHSPSAKSKPHPSEGEAIIEQIASIRSHLRKDGLLNSKRTRPATKRLITRMNQWAERRGL